MKSKKGIPCSNMREFDAIMDGTASDSKPQHTPTPWKSEGHDIVSVNPDRHIAAIIRHNPGTTVDEQIANASFIVRAVNCHEDLMRLAKFVAAHAHTKDCFTVAYREQCACGKDIAEKAIAKGEGK